MHLIKQLEEEFHGHKKAIEDSPETEHTRILYLRRIMRVYGLFHRRAYCPPTLEHIDNDTHWEHSMGYSAIHGEDLFRYEWSEF